MVPDWLKNNIAAEDGNIKCTLSRYEMREASSGIIRNVNTLGFVGGKGQQKLAWLDGIVSVQRFINNLTL